jgi:hypothetical protein
MNFNSLSKYVGGVGWGRVLQGFRNHSLAVSEKESLSKREGSAESSFKEITVLFLVVY